VWGVLALNDASEMCSPYADRECHDNIILVPDSDAVRFDEYPVREVQDNRETKKSRTNVRSTIRSKAKESAK
jgi:hypothetical protein